MGYSKKNTKGLRLKLCTAVFNWEKRKCLILHDQKLLANDGSSS